MPLTIQITTIAVRIFQTWWRFHALSTLSKASRHDALSRTRPSSLKAEPLRRSHNSCHFPCSRLSRLGRAASLDPFDMLIIQVENRRNIYPIECIAHLGLFAHPVVTSDLHLRLNHLCPRAPSSFEWLGMMSFWYCATRHDSLPNACAGSLGESGLENVLLLIEEALRECPHSHSG